MILESIAIGAYQTNCYIFGNEQTKEVLVIDAGEMIEELIDYLTKKAYVVTKILITHGHFDHTNGIVKLKDFTKAKTYMNPLDLPMLQQPDCIDESIKDGDRILIGDKTIKIIHTPGHTQGGVCYYVDNILFSGDTLFNGSIGRTDLPGGNYPQLISTIHTKLMQLPDDTIVYPGHGPSTTIGKERSSNPFLS